ncbi:LysR family transcriptional regulator [Bacterioplanes sanyensis]|uniref:LysR family transcriptional regulator n=1 Tax=Bacterioplanes sanyensis TaxID=1249553 RepID=UPI0018EE4A11|nr:LysR family transcriptional regulator [Bacterioplanes sanyensis]
MARLGSFSGAATELGQPASTISRRIAQMEKDIGRQLLVRNTRNMRLTAAGKELQALMSHLDREYLAVLDWVNSQGEVSGKFRLTAPHQFIEYPLTDWLIEYQQHYPQLVIEVVGSNEYLDFYQHRIDLAFRQGPLPDSGLHQRRIFSLEYGLFASPEYLKRQAYSDSFDWLTKQRSIGIGAHGKRFPWLLTRRNKPTQYTPTTSILLESPNQGVKAALAGLGVVYTSTHNVYQAIEDGALQPICPSLWPEPVGFYMVYDESRYKSKVLQTFMDFAKSKVKELHLLQGIIV